jgi:hypothetical protein
LTCLLLTAVAWVVEVRMSQSAARATRLTRSYRQTIDAPPDTVFPLLCPVREAEWLDGWTCEMTHSATGLAEPDAVFTTPAAGEADTVWVVSRHDRAAGLVEFVRFTPGSRTCHLTIAVSPDEGGRSSVDVTYVQTALTPHGDAFLAAWTEAAFLDAMAFWERSMNHFLSTGRRLTRTDR